MGIRCGFFRLCGLCFLALALSIAPAGTCPIAWRVPGSASVASDHDSQTSLELFLSPRPAYLIPSFYLASVVSVWSLGVFHQIYPLPHLTLFSGCRFHSLPFRSPTGRCLHVLSRAVAFPNPTQLALVVDERRAIRPCRSSVTSPSIAGIG